MLLKILRSFYWVPVLGMLLREALDGPDEARYLFASNLVMSVILAVIIFGYQAFVAIVLTAVATMFVIIFDITRSERPLPGRPGNWDEP
jgi:hypothetical protein